MKKLVILGVFILFFGMIWGSSNATLLDTRFSSQSFSGSLLYVGGNGPNNYTTIQEAINHATDGDTVFVYAVSSPYVEHVLVNRSIDLIGENKDTTVIDGSGVGDVVLLSADNVTLSGFTVQHSGDNPKVDAGIESRSNRSTIFGNIVIQNGRYGVGILLNGSSDALVYNNFISENGNEGVFLEKSIDVIVRDNLITRNGHCAIVISQSSGNTIIQNTMANNYAGVSLWPGATNNEITSNIIRNQTYSGVGIWPEADNNTLHHNVLSNNSLYGFLITKAQGNIIASNTIQGSNEGLRLFMANRSTFQNNNFIENNCSAFFENSSFNRWRQNYWDDHTGIWPKCIHGLIRVPWNKTKVIRWINMDWRPAQKPYDISLVGGTVE
jgi:parallel beta-helix repeat protein